MRSSAISLCAIALFTATAHAADVDVKQSDGTIDIAVNGKPFTTLVAKKDKLAKPYLYPILAPCGVPVTRDWPMKTGSANETKDHVHQKSAWFCHGDVIPEGITLKVKSSDKRVHGVDFWAESAGYGTIETASMNATRDGSTAVITLQLNWMAPEKLRVLRETRIYRIHAVEGGRMIEMTSQLFADEFGVILGDTKEGSFGIRVSDTLRMTNKAGDGMLTNSAGKSGMKDVWGYVADWCDYSGTIDGKSVGVAVFAHRKNPQPSYWHARDYGLLAANPFGRKESGFPGAKEAGAPFKIAKGSSATFRFAIFAHDGNAKSGRVAEAYQVYSGGS